MAKVVITKSKLDALAQHISAKAGTSGTLTIAQMQAAVDGIAISGGAKGFRRYTYDNPADVSGAGNYITAVSQDAELARVRSVASLVVLYHLTGDSGCTKSGIACNTVDYLPYHVAAANQFGAVRRLNSAGDNMLTSIPYLVSDGTSLSTGSGRVYITPEGDLRIYGNTNGYPIKAGTVLVEVIWEEET